MAVVAGSSQLGPYPPNTYGNGHAMNENDTYEDQVVPALRKRKLT